MSGIRELLNRMPLESSGGGEEGYDFHTYVWGGTTQGGRGWGASVEQDGHRLKEGHHALSSVVEVGRFEHMLYERANRLATDLCAHRRAKELARLL